MAGRATTATNLTSQRVVKATQYVHQRTTRNNTPITPPIAYHAVYQTPRKTAFISQKALCKLVDKTMYHATEHFTPQCLQGANVCNTPTPLEEVANDVVHPDTKETITRYSQLINDLVLRVVWLKAMCIELGRLSNGYKDTKGTQTIHYMTHEEIKCIPGDIITVTYARIVVDFRPQKTDPNRVRITVGRNLIDYPYGL